MLANPPGRNFLKTIPRVFTVLEHTLLKHMFQRQLQELEDGWGRAPAETPGGLRPQVHTEHPEMEGRGSEIGRPGGTLRGSGTELGHEQAPVFNRQAPAFNLKSSVLAGVLGSSTGIQ